MDSDVRVRGFTSRSAVCRLMIGSAPVTGTVPGTGGIGWAYGLMLRWWRIVENHPIWCTTSSGLHARPARAARAAKTATAAPDLRTAHLLRPGGPQEGLHLPRARRLARHEDSELVVGEAWIVRDGPEATGREQGIEQNAEDGRQRAEQDRHLEHDHDVRRNRADGLAAQYDRPIVRHVQREPRADGAAGDPADQREHPHRAHGLVEGVFDLVTRNRRVDGEVRVAGSPEPADRVDRGIEVAEHGKSAGCGRRMKDGRQRIHELHATRSFPRVGAGRTSFTSEIDTAGKIFTNRRNHMKNQPKLPAMMPQSAHVGL